MQERFIVQLLKFHYNNGTIEVKDSRVRSLPGNPWIFFLQESPRIKVLEI